MYRGHLVPKAPGALIPAASGSLRPRLPLSTVIENYLKTAPPRIPGVLNNGVGGMPEMTRNSSVAGVSQGTPRAPEGVLTRPSRAEMAAKIGLVDCFAVDRAKSEQSRNGR